MACRCVGSPAGQEQGELPSLGWKYTDTHGDSGMKQKGRERETLGKYPNNYNHAGIIRSMSEPPSCTDHSSTEGVVVVKINMNH